MAQDIFSSECFTRPPLLPQNVPASVFFGQPCQVLEETENDFLTVLSGGMAEAKMPYVFSLKALPCHMLLFTRAGAGYLLDKKERILLKEDSLLYFDCRAFSDWQIEAAQPGWSYYVFFAKGDMFDVYEKLYPGTKRILTDVASHSAILPCLEQLFMNLNGNSLQEKLTDAAALNCIMTELWLGALPPKVPGKEHPTWLLEIRYSLDTFFMEPFSLQELEQRYNISKYRICREFSAAFGKPPLRYLNDVRIEAAKKLLLAGDIRIQEVALKVGIENTTHFINLFKQRTGLTPHAFRQIRHGHGG